MLREFESAFGKEEVGRVLTAWSEKMGAAMAPSDITNFSEFKDYWKSTLASENWSKILTCSFPMETETELGCKYTECLWAKTMKDLDATDLGHVMFCHPDFTMAKAMNPKLTLERTKTLMEGHDFCNHTYSWEE